MPFLPSDDKTPVQKFQTEVLAVLNRWSEESDLDDVELVQAAVDSLNVYFNNLVTFDSDDQAFFGEEEEDEI